jgi:hypothetical protein
VQIVWVAGGVFARDGLLCLFAILSGLALAGAIGLTTLILYAGKALERLSHGDVRVIDAIFFLGAYLLVCFAALYFNVALVATARDRIEKAISSFSITLDAINYRLGAIAGWAAYAATIGAVVKRIGRRRSASDGRRSLFGGGSGVLVLPVMVVEAETPVGALGRSEELLSEWWGDATVPNFNFLVVYAYAAVIGLALGAGLHLLLGTVTLPIVAGCALFLTAAGFVRAIEALLAASLYYYAVSGGSAAFFPEEMLRRAFVDPDERGRWRQAHLRTYKPLST